MDQNKIKGVTERLICIFIICNFIVLMPLIISIASNEMETGAEILELFGGSSGKVRFPHRLHQVNLGDCDTCHSVFPKVSGSIENLKAKGEIEKKQVMSQLCINCHRLEKQRGKPSGPTTCFKCHVKQDPSF